MSGRMIKTIHGKRYQEKTVNELVSMLSENTGIHMCDSGGDSGRFWQRNQGKTRKDWIKSPEVSIDFEKVYIWNEETKKYEDAKPTQWRPMYTVSIFHYLASVLKMDDICEAFNKINKKSDNFDSDAAYGLSSEGEEFLERIGAKISGAWNSYNGEDPYSQVTQGSPVNINEEYYILLQIHGGADVRGGYTTARLFKIQEYAGCDGMYYPPSMIWANIAGKGYVMDEGYSGAMVEYDETEQEQGYGGAEAIIISEDEPTVTACGFDACY
jgi:hypothetical protein